MAKIIIGIHGLDNKPPQNILECWWRKAIDEGLQLIGESGQSYRFKLVYWTDILHTHPLDPYENQPSHDLYLNEPYVPGQGIEKRKSHNLRMVILDKLENILDSVLFNKKIYQKISLILNKVWLNKFTDLKAYFSQQKILKSDANALIRDMIQKRLEKEIIRHKKKEILLIAHSMGSIIAYDVLSRLKTGIGIDTFVTIGSPLGFPVIMWEIAKEHNIELSNSGKLKTPDSVRNKWYNLSDLEDNVALNYNLADDYIKNTYQVGPEDKIVNNDYQYNEIHNHHKSYGYLRTSEMAGIINEFLTKEKPTLVRKLLTFIKRWI